MPPLPDEYKEAMKAYANGFVIGAFLGLVLCLALAKFYLFLPVVLGLVCGGIAFDRKLNSNGNK